MSSPTILAVLGVYLVLLIGIGFWGARGARGMSAYFLADKKLPAWVIAFSSNATGERTCSDHRLRVASRR